MSFDLYLLYRRYAKTCTFFFSMFKRFAQNKLLLFSLLTPHERVGNFFDKPKARKRNLPSLNFFDFTER